jgi:hypothetical protein
MKSRWFRRQDVEFKTMTDVGIQLDLEWTQVGSGSRMDAGREDVEWKSMTDIGIRLAFD